LAVRRCAVDETTFNFLNKEKNMKDQETEVAQGVSAKDAKRMQAVLKAIGTLSCNHQETLLKMAEQRLKTLKLGLEVTDYEDNLYKETWMRAKGRPHR
jgi:hypothetical protein